ncbi:MAG: hypothetical protein J6W76_00225, partial [Spirochaetales bacterium]|nr:hypothetical protein [Spirochaetales bacterium]
MFNNKMFLPCFCRACQGIARQYFFIISIIVSLLFTSCGVLLDDAKFRGLWHLTEVRFYQYNEEYNSYLTIEGLDDTTPDTSAPIISNFFGVTMTKITMTINTNKTWTAKGYPPNSTAEEQIVSDSDSGKWDIDTYNNTITLTCPKGNKDSTADQLWSNNKSVTNAWPMTTNNKFDFYIKASDFGRDYFEFEIAEKPVPDRIEKQRLDEFLETNINHVISDDSGNSVNIKDFCLEWYKLDDNEEYYYLINSISV